MPLSFVVMELLAMLAFSSLSLVIVEVEGDREKVLARGPRCVSLSSVVEVLSANPGTKYHKKLESCVASRPTWKRFKIRRRKTNDSRSRQEIEKNGHVLLVSFQDILME